MSNLERYGLEWKSAQDFVCHPMDDGYWTPWHIAHEQITTLRQKLEQAEARVAELAHSRQIEKTSMLMRVSQLSETLEAIRSGEFSLPKCQQLADRALGSPVTEAAILRLQAEAVKESAQEMLEEWPEFDVAHQWLIVRSESLTQQADEAERAGGER